MYNNNNNNLINSKMMNSSSSTNHSGSDVCLITYCMFYHLDFVTCTFCFTHISFAAFVCLVCILFKSASTVSEQSVQNDIIMMLLLLQTLTPLSCVLFVCF